MSNQEPITPPKNPTQLLQEQLTTLSAILLSQQETNRLLTELHEELSEENDNHVEVDDFNMPMNSIIGFLIKLSVASIFAGIIIAIIYFVIRLILGIIFPYSSYW
jgi:hypothetical protein